MSDNPYLEKYRAKKASQDNTRIGELQNQRAELVKNLFLSESSRAELEFDEADNIIPNRHNGTLLEGKLECFGACLDEMQRILEEKMEKVAEDPSSFRKRKGAETGEEYIGKLREIHQAAEEVKQITRPINGKLRPDEIAKQLLNEDLTEPLAKLGKSTDELHSLDVLSWDYFGPSYGHFDPMAGGGRPQGDSHPIIAVGRTALDLSRGKLPEFAEMNAEITRLSQTQVE